MCLNIKTKNKAKLLLTSFIHLTTQQGTKRRNFIRPSSLAVFKIAFRFARLVLKLNQRWHDNFKDQMIKLDKATELKLRRNSKSKMSLLSVRRKLVFQFRVRLVILSVIFLNLSSFESGSVALETGESAVYISKRWL